jgi:predicted dehydrogenase
MVHGPGLAGARGVELVGVWGRSSERSQALASTLGVQSYDDVAALISDVEAVAFAVPPEVQAELAVLAADAGRHLLLDKPVAATAESARLVRDAVDRSGVASVVFFTDRFVDSSRQWFEQVQETGGWRGGWLRWFSALQDPDNPFGASPWRHELGALWDTGPHAISTLTAALGPITSVRAAGGERDLVVLTCSHESGATSTATLSAFAPLPATGFEAAVWGETGLFPMPPRPDGSKQGALGLAAEELIAAASGDRSHPSDVRLGVHVVELLADAAAQVTAARTMS